LSFNALEQRPWSFNAKLQHIKVETWSFNAPDNKPLNFNALEQKPWSLNTPNQRTWSFKTKLQCTQRTTKDLGVST
jgi:hypothetical protein